MCTVLGSVIHAFRSVVKKGLKVTRRHRGPNVQITANSAVICLRASTPDLAMEFRQPGTFSPFHCVLPFDMLRNCQASRQSKISFQADADRIRACWYEMGIPQQVEAKPETFQPFPELPASWEENPPELMDALRNASDSAEREPSTFTLSHIRLRGRDGQIVGTDGRQLFSEDGFKFPWQQSHLIQASPLFRLSEMRSKDRTFVGKAIDWIAFRTGRWTIWFKINKTGRYPEIDSLLEKSQSAISTLRLDESDAGYLLRSIKHLPSEDVLYAPITVDLNGAVVLRAKAPGKVNPTEVVLTRSSKEGANLRFAANRQYLTRAVQLGFREFSISRGESRVVAQAGKRSMVWANLCQDSVIAPRQSAIRVESPCHAPT
ncbi:MULTISPECIES: hypothetical protein [Pirellulaceae]|nr:MULTISPECIES: hypothetical protein [Pirellulaceae]